MNSSQTERDEKNTRKPYGPPQLQIYGDLRTITQNNSMAGPPDHNNPHGDPVGNTR